MREQIESITRREALKYAGLIVLVARGGLSLPGYAAPELAKGYGTDPDLLKRPVTWPKTLNGEQIKALTALCEIVLPPEPPHPSAATLGVQDFLDEWVSAPYPQMQTDRELILGGLAVLDKVTRRSEGISFAEADLSRQADVFDHLCAGKESQRFTQRLIELVCAGYYTMREGHAAIGYVGNVALARFPPPSTEIVQHFEQALNALAPRSQGGPA